MKLNSINKALDKVLQMFIECVITRSIAATLSSDGLSGKIAKTTLNKQHLQSFIVVLLIEFNFIIYFKSYFMP